MISKLRTVLDKIRKDLPINQHKTNLKFYKNFMYEFKTEGSLFYEKNSKHKYLKPQFAGLFGHIAGSVNQPRIVQF